MRFQVSVDMLYGSRLFVKAINEAVYDVIHKAVIGMTCPCVFFASYRPSPVEGETLSFVQQLALDPTNVPQYINSSKEVARVLAFRKARYAKVDEPYFLAFGVTPIRPRDPVVASINQEIFLFQAELYRNQRVSMHDSDMFAFRHSDLNLDTNFVLV
ncbi:hypothetical protein L6452_16848 [Arctium lappa]|uniref:Uncharacterized protein n=1 Tax=Arctium lappa TaxID=4217 RepID=A0ACB9C1S3_ARCLA|nr:hypothetical protein L6452_16848 [Arctium lappa]